MGGVPTVVTFNLTKYFVNVEEKEKTMSMKLRISSYPCAATFIQQY